VKISSLVRSATSADHFTSSGLLVRQVIAECAKDQPFNARSVLEDYPELNEHKSALLELAYEEYCRLSEQGTATDPEVFAKRYPTVFRSLVHRIEVHRLMSAVARTLDSDCDPDWPEINEIWLGFQLVDELGRGAFSRVYLARERALGDRLVVVKATSLGQLEADTLGRLQHPNIVPVHSVQRDEIRGLTAVCMPFLGRRTLFDVVDKVFSAPAKISNSAELFTALHDAGASPSGVSADSSVPGWRKSTTYAEVVIRIGLQVARALGEAHRQGVLHCDVKPSNVLLTDAGEARLLDFNLALVSGGAGEQIGGTLPYMAPEQLRTAVPSATPEERKLDQRTDVYCLGVTLFELLYGRLPFGPPAIHLSRDRAASHLLEKQRHGPAVPKSRNPYVDRSVAEVVARCLEFDPSRRPQTMDELASLLSARLTPARRAVRWVGAHRRLTAAVSSCTSLCIVAIAIGLASRLPYPIREWRAGEECYKRGEYAGAVQHCNLALEQDSNLFDARLLRACAYYRQKDFVSSYGEFKSLSEVWDDWRPLAGMGQSMAAMDGNYGLAGGLYRGAIDHGGRSAILLNNLGYCLNTQYRLQEASDFLTQACDRDPDSPAAHHNLARVELRMAVRKRMPNEVLIENALRFAPETTQLDIDAAMFYAACSNFSKEIDRQRYQIDQVFDRLERAFDRGMQADELPAVLMFNSRLQSDPRWEQLKAGKVATKPRTDSELLADIIPDILAPRSDSTDRANRSPVEKLVARRVGGPQSPPK